MSRKCLVCGRTTENVLETDACPGCGRVYAKVEQLTRDQLLAARQSFRASSSTPSRAPGPAVFTERAARYEAAQQAEARDQEESRAARLRAKGERQRASVLRRAGMNGEAVYVVGVHIPFRNMLENVMKFALASIIVSLIMVPVWLVVWALGFGALIQWLTGGLN